MQVLLVYLQPFCRNLLLRSVPQQKFAKKIHQNPSMGGSRSFKGIDVEFYDKSKKPISSAFL